MRPYRAERQIEYSYSYPTDFPLVDLILCLPCSQPSAHQLPSTVESLSSSDALQAVRLDIVGSLEVMVELLEHVVLV